MLENMQNYVAKEEKIVIIGAGSVGITTCFEFYRRKYTDIKLLSNKILNVGTKFNIINQLDKRVLNDADVIVDATGNKSVIKEISKNIKYLTNKKIILLGTPRTEITIDLTTIHKNNVSLIGAHEFNGIQEEFRQRVFNEILLFYKNEDIEEYKNFIDVHNYSEKLRKELLSSKKTKAINIFKY
jgi:threonine dehydrogenase-like Zn-dependent dehydrogenase